MRYLREAVQKGLDLTLDQGLRLEADLYFLIQTTADRSGGHPLLFGEAAAELPGRVAVAALLAFLPDGYRLLRPRSQHKARKHDAQGTL